MSAHQRAHCEHCQDLLEALDAALNEAADLKAKLRQAALELHGAMADLEYEREHGWALFGDTRVSLPGREVKDSATRT